MIMMNSLYFNSKRFQINLISLMIWIDSYPLIQLTVKNSYRMPKVNNKQIKLQER